MAGKQQLLDRFTSVDELLSSIYEILKKQYDKNYEIFYLTYPNDGTRATFSVGTTTLDFAAGTIKFPDGSVDNMSSSLRKQKRDSMRSFAINCDQAVVVQLDSNNKAPVRANVWGKMTYQQFTEARVTTTVETIGYIHACTNPQAIHEQIGETTIAVGREERSRIKSSVGAHFTGALAQYDAEEENLTGLEANEITITTVAAYSQQALDLRLLLYETDEFQAADMDDDEFVEGIHLDIPTDGVQYKNANGYYIAATGLDINYKDLDGSKELHVALENIGSTAKLASGSGGNLWIKFEYIPRL